MYLTGFADEASTGLEGQIRATRELGWRHLEARNIDGVNLTSVDEATFEVVHEKLEEAGIRVSCFGSAVANWAKKITEPPESSYEELARAIPRMHRMGVEMIRVMSFSTPRERIGDPAIAAEAIGRMKVLARMAEEGGVTLVHENCDGWGAASYEHTLRLLEQVDSPALKLVFDTGNPVFHDDLRGEPPYRKQDALEFYHRVKDHVVYVHIKDGRMVDGKVRFTFAGEGDGHVRQVCADLRDRGYDGGISIEPHLAAVVHDPSVTSSEEVKYANYIEYGRRMEKLLHELDWPPSC